MDTTLTETLEQNDYPLAFKVTQGQKRSPVLDGSGHDVFKVEARQLVGHQKEAIVTQGAGGSGWRMVSDEGKQLKGSDLAPFPLGFFNAGIQGDLYRRLRALALRQGIAIEALRVGLINGYGLTGSFVHGTGEGHADPSEIEVRLTTSASAERVNALVASALDASPTIAYLRTAMSTNTFALYINGRRRQVEGVPASSATDAVDPYRVYTRAPAPLSKQGRRDLIEKAPQQESGEAAVMPPSNDKRISWYVHGAGAPMNDAAMFEVDTWLGRPGASHFRLRSDEGQADVAPSGLAMFSAAISFCYMTQLSRYIENMKMRISGVRLVQFNPYTSGERAAVGPIDTHLFLNGEAPEETHLKLLTVAAHTCYLHAAAKAALEPKLRVILNEVPLVRVA